MKFTTLSMVALTTALMIPTHSSAQIFGGNSFNTNTLLGSVAGGVIGSQLAGRGARTEGSAIGAVVGGLAANHFLNGGSSRYGSSYPGYGPSNNSGLVGAGLGAIAGGVLGSNLAGSGVQQEGTAIGAVLGGLVGYGLTNRSNGYSNGSSRYGASGYGASGYGYASAPYPTFGGNVIAPAPYPAPYPASMPMPMHIPTPQYMYGPQFVSQSYQIPSTTRHVYHTAPTPAPIINRVIHHQAPAVQPEIRTIHVYQQDVAPTYSTQHSSQQFYIKGLPIAPAISTLPAPAYARSNGVYCYSGSNKRYDSYGNEIFQSASCG